MSGESNRTIKVLAVSSLALLLAVAVSGCSTKYAKTSSEENIRLADELHAEGLILWNQENYEQAIEAWLKEIELAPLRPKPYNNIGMTYRRLGESEKALEYHEMAIKADPSFGHSYYSLGLIYYDRGEFNKVIELMEKADKNGYSNADVYYTKGQAHRIMEAFEEAARAYERTIELYYGYPGVHYALGEAYRQLGKYDMAKLEYQKEIFNNNTYDYYCNIGMLEVDAARDPGNPDIHFELGKQYGKSRNRGFMDKAMAAFRKVIEIDPMYPNAHLEMGRLHERMLDIEAARNEFIKELEVTQGNAEAAGALGYLEDMTDFSDYENSNLKEIGDMVKAQAVEHEGGFELYVNKYILRVRLSSYPQQIGNYAEGVLDIMWGSFGFLKPENKSIYTHELEVEEGGHSFTLVFQDALIPHLINEVSPGDEIDLYVVLGVYDINSGMITMLVNEFSTYRDEEGHNIRDEKNDISAHDNI